MRLNSKDIRRVNVLVFSAPFEQPFKLMVIGLTGNRSSRVRIVERDYICSVCCKVSFQPIQLVHDTGTQTHERASHDITFFV